MMKNLKISLLSLSAVGLLAACGSDNNETETEIAVPAVEEQKKSEETVQTPDTTSDAYTAISIHPEEAFDLFLDQQPDAKITQIQLDEENNSYIYEVEGFDGTQEYELKIDAVDGNLLNEDTDTDKDRDDRPLTREQVEKVKDLVDEAMMDVGEGVRLDEWTLDIDDGLAILEIDLDKQDGEDVEYSYNVDTGELLEIDN